LPDVDLTRHYRRNLGRDGARPSNLSGERRLLACRCRQLAGNNFQKRNLILKKDCFGETPKPARETRALPTPIREIRAIRGCIRKLGILPVILDRLEAVSAEVRAGLANA